MADLIKEKNPIITPEKPRSAEGLIEAEKKLENEQKNTTETTNEKPAENVEAVVPKKPVRKQIPVPVPTRDPLAIKVEKILEENVGDAYQMLSPIAKQEFKLKGEVTAKKIAELLKSTHIKVKKIFQLIFEWLRMLPGINKFFLEQEAKIKTDRIIALHKK